MAESKDHSEYRREPKNSRRRLVLAAVAMVAAACGSEQAARSVPSSDLRLPSQSTDSAGDASTEAGPPPAGVDLVEVRVERTPDELRVRFVAAEPFAFSADTPDMAATGQGRVAWTLAVWDALVPERPAYVAFAAPPRADGTPRVGVCPISEETWERRHAFSDGNPPGGAVVFNLCQEDAFFGAVTHGNDGRSLDVSLPLEAMPDFPAAGFAWVAATSWAAPTTPIAPGDRVPGGAGGPDVLETPPEGRVTVPATGQ